MAITTCRAIACAASLAILAGGSAVAAERKEVRKEVRKASKKTETLACRLGTEDRHARIAVVLVGGKTDAFAYYSKWKPRTCSIYLQRQRDPYSKWADNGDITTVNVEKGAFLIEHKKNGEYHFIFRDIDRERYCGMDGVINGSLTIKKGSDQCVLAGELMVEGTPLGEANIARAVETPEPSQGTSDVRQAGLPAATPATAAEGNASARAETKPAPAAETPAAPAAIVTSAPAVTPAPAASAAPAAAAEVKPEPPPDVKPAAAAEVAPAPKAQTAATGGSAPSTNGGDAAPAAVTPTAAEKPAESSNPFSALFRSLSTTRND